MAEDSLLAVRMNASCADMDAQLREMGGRGDRRPTLASISRQTVGSLVGAPAATCRGKKENGAETKSSAPILPLSTAKCVAIARAHHETDACTMSRTPGPSGAARRGKGSRVASAHCRPSF